VNASIILAGDPKQLGPVIYSQLGVSLGLDQSYLERLMSHQMYRKNSVTGKYDSTLITKLKKNYRSHPLLIELSNRLFYDCEIEARGDKSIAWRISIFCEIYRMFASRHNLRFAKSRMPDFGQSILPDYVSRHVWPPRQGRKLTKVS
jgi:hypothetical protein